MIDAILKFLSPFVIAVGKVHWGFKGGITADELEALKKALASNYFIILTRRKNHLSTFFVGLAGLVLSGKWGYWAHALMNCEDTVLNDGQFRLVEATGTGTHYSPVDLVFQVHSVSLLKPKSMTLERWTAVLDRLKSDIGKPYDTLFDLQQDKKLSCVELVRNALMAEPNYEMDFADFERLIKKTNKLSPDMFANCTDFEEVYSVKH